MALNHYLLRDARVKMLALKIKDADDYDRKLRNGFLQADDVEDAIWELSLEHNVSEELAEAYFNLALKGVCARAAK